MYCWYVVSIPLFRFTEETDERLKPKGNESYIDFDDDDNGDIPVIPNLEEVQEEVGSLCWPQNWVYSVLQVVPYKSYGSCKGREKGVRGVRGV